MNPHRGTLAGAPTLAQEHEEKVFDETRGWRQRPLSSRLDHHSGGSQAKSGRPIEASPFLAGRNREYVLPLPPIDRFLSSGRSCLGVVQETHRS
jgi:hypothetical protein